MGACGGCAPADSKETRSPDQAQKSPGQRVNQKWHFASLNAQKKQNSKDTHPRHRAFRTSPSFAAHPAVSPQDRFAGAPIPGAAMKHGAKKQKKS